MRTSENIGAAVLAFLVCTCVAAPFARAEEGEQPAFEHPIVFTAPAGDVLPHGKFYSRVGMDTDADFIGSVFYGLGGIADFGFTSTPYVRFERPGSDFAEGSLAYPMMVGRLGVPHGLLGRWQPGISAGIRKSFDVKQFGRKTNVSEWFLVATVDAGQRLSLTLGVAKWDGEIRFDERTDNPEWALDLEKTYLERIRPFGGLEVMLVPRHSLVFEWYYMPEFEYAIPPAPPNIEVDAATSLGLRSQLREWLTVDAGVRGPDVTNLHQIDVEFFVQAIAHL